MHMMEQTPEAEAGSHRSSGHRIENAPLSEYQKFQSNVVNTRTFRSDGLYCYPPRSACNDALSGKVKLKVEPLPTSLSTQILPPCSSTNF